MSSDTMMRGVVAAAVAKLDEASLPLRDLLSADSSAEGLAGYFMRLHHLQSLQELRAQEFKTNDILEISDNILEALESGRVGVNGSSIDLEVREMLVVFGLAREVRRRSRAWVLGREAEAHFVRVSALIEEIDRAKAEAGLPNLWRNAIDTDVHKAVSSLRSKLAGAGLNRNLIEGRRGSGYRLSTPYWNLVEPGANDARK
jgi:hypothetical protein